MPRNRMRSIPVTLCASLLLSCSPGTPDKPAAAAAQGDDACTVALRFTETWLAETRSSRPLVFSDAPDATMDLPGGGPWTRMNGPGEQAPSPEMLEAAGDLSRDSAVASCPALRAWLDRQHVPHGEKAVSEVVGEPNGTDSHRADILGLTLPVVSPDGTEALTVTSYTTGPLSGVGQLFLLQRQPDGSWRAVSARHLWIS
jgi:hypothetical protein